MQDESKPTNEPTPKPKRTLEEFYQETRAGRDLIAARRRLQDSLNQKQGGPPMPDENAQRPQDETQSKPPPPYEHPAAAFYREHAAEMARRRPFLPKMISVPDPHPRDPTMDPPQTITYIDPNQ